MKTPQEAAREYMQNVLNDSDLSVNYEEDNYDAGVMHTLTEALEPAFLAGDAFGYRRGMEKAYRWISVEDEFPEYYKDVFVKYKRDGIVRYEVCWLAIGDDDNYLRTSSGGYLINRNDVIAWRPIEPIKE